MQYANANTSRFTFTIATGSITKQVPFHNELRVYQFDLTESLSDHFCLNIDFICDDQNIDYQSLVKKTALLTIQGEDEVQYLNGIICEAQCIENGTRFARYSAKVVPMAWFLEYRKGCRIFQELDVREIISLLFEEAGMVSGTHFQWSTDRTYPKRTFCTQYNETEWQFITRLMAEEGIHFHYQQSADKHLMIIGDSKTALSPVDNEATIPYVKNSGLTETSEHINQFAFSENIQSGKSTLRDYNFKTPRRSLEKFNQNKFNPTLEDYHYPGEYKTEAEAEFYTTLKQEQYNAQIKAGEGTSNVQRLRAGKLFTQTGHRYRANNIEHLITHVFHEGKQPQSLDEDASTNMDDGTRYQNTFNTMPADTLFRPKPIKRTSLIHGQQNAFITGPEGEEIYVNEYGQVKVQLLWDREGQYNEKTTCWLRVNNELAGNQWGQIMTPRIGQHVFIEFEHGNPDRPLISGRSYNGDSLPPYTLPANKTRSTMKTNSSPGGDGYNEIRYEDKKSQEQIYFHSEKDQDIRCKNDRREHIENTRSLIVDNEQHEHIKVNQHQKVNNNYQHKVGSKLSQDIGNRLHIKAGSNFLQSAGNEVHIKSASSTILDAGSEITFKASGGFIKIDPSGVTINGIKVNLNSGGSPGSASASSPITPFQAVEADKDKPGQNFKPITPEAAYKLSQFLFSKGAGNERTLDTDKFGGCKPCTEAAEKGKDKSVLL